MRVVLCMPRFVVYNHHRCLPHLLSSARHHTTPVHSLITRAMATSSTTTTPQVLPGKHDAYNGIQIAPESLPYDAVEFSDCLRHSIEHWQAENMSGIWLKVPVTKAHLIAEALQQGFDCHHAEKEYIMLTRWLPTTENKLPPNASHQVGVGAFVLNERREVLVVQEKSGPLKGKGVWKLPTGLVMQGEDITAAAAREVLEETGVIAEPVRVLAMRQAHGFSFSKSDLFFVVALRPQPGQHHVQPQEDEIEDAQWMPLDEYAQLPFVQTRTLLRKLTECCVAYADGQYQGWAPEVLDYGADSNRVDLFATGVYEGKH